MVLSKSTDRHVVDKDVLPIFVMTKEDPSLPLSFEGTGFVLGNGLLVTCWHCVAATLPDDQVYAVAFEQETGKYSMASLDDIEQDPSGVDLATARVALRSTLGLTIPDNDLAYGTDVWTFGYPLTERRPLSDGQQSFQLAGRYLQGYVMRSFYFDAPNGARVLSYELDMPTPEGLSGAPLVRVGTKQVYGVVYGTNEVALIDQTAFVDPESGRREPEIQRLVTFGLAHYTQSLRALCGAATKGLPLHDFLTKAN